MAKPKRPRDTNNGAGSKLRTIESQIKKGDFFGRPLQTCIKKVLDLRQSIGEGPTEVKEIYRLLNLGDYEFNTKDANNAITGLWVSISKNSNWYPDKPKQRKKDREDGEVAAGNGQQADEQPASEQQP